MSIQPDDNVAVTRNGRLETGIVVGVGSRIHVLFQDGTVIKYSPSEIVNVAHFEDLVRDPASNNLHS